MVDIKAFFKIQCGLYVAAVGTEEKKNGLITNTIMQHSHMPPKFSLTLEKNHLTHDMLIEKKSVGISALADDDVQDLIKRFGFVSGRSSEKFEGYDDYFLDANGNPLLTGKGIAAVFSFTVFETVDVGTHTIFMCTCDEAQDEERTPITYLGYRDKIRK